MGQWYTSPNPGQRYIIDQKPGSINSVRKLLLVPIVASTDEKKKSTKDNHDSLLLERTTLKTSKTPK